MVACCLFCGPSQATRLGHLVCFNVRDNHAPADRADTFDRLRDRLYSIFVRKRCKITRDGYLRHFLCALFIVAVLVAAQSMVRVVVGLDYHLFCGLYHVDGIHGGVM